MRRLFVACSRAAFKGLYRITRRDERENLAVFLSRQTDEPSYDFEELSRELESRGWRCIMHLKKVRARNIVKYVAHVIREIKLLGSCKLVILDRYDPVVSLLDFECDEMTGKRTGASPQSRTESSHSPDGIDVAAKSTSATSIGGSNADLHAKCAPTPQNLDFPRKPVVLQIWHAFGAYKKFGFQSVGTLEGHSADFTDTYNIHRNYSWVLCSGSGARDAFAEAFSCPRERVIPLVRPEFDELVAARDKRADEKRGLDTRNAARGKHNQKLRVLMAPTLRKSSESAHPFKDLYEARTDFEGTLNAEVTWSFHPLEEGLPAPGNVSSQLLAADVLVTDYSSIAYEACVLEIPVVFYMPDLESYRVSPGLNADPQRICPEICTFSPDELAELLNRLEADPASYPAEAQHAFACTGFDDDIESLPGTAASRIIDFALEQIAR